MAKAGEIHTKLSRLPGEMRVKVNVHKTQQLKVRMWLGKQLIRLAARVMGCGIKVERGEA